LLAIFPEKCGVLTTDLNHRLANRLDLNGGDRQILADTVPDLRALVGEIRGRLDGGELQTLYDLFDRLDEDRP
jgi:hypothetical protein